MNTRSFSPTEWRIFPFGESCVERNSFVPHRERNPHKDSSVRGMIVPRQTGTGRRQFEYSGSGGFRESSSGITAANQLRVRYRFGRPPKQRSQLSTSPLIIPLFPRTTAASHATRLFLRGFHIRIRDIADR